MQGDFEEVKAELRQFKTLSEKQDRMANMLSNFEAAKASTARQDQICSDMQSLMGLLDQRGHLRRQVASMKADMESLGMSSPGGVEALNSTVRSLHVVQTQISHQQRVITEDIDRLANQLRDLKTVDVKRSILADTEEILARTVRTELQTLLTPVIQECLLQHGPRYEGVLSQVCDTLQTIHSDILERSSPTNIQSSPERNLSSFDLQAYHTQPSGHPGGLSGRSWVDRDGIITSNAASPDGIKNPNQAQRLQLQSLQRGYKSTVIRKQNWNFTWSIGRLHIVVKTLVNKGWTTPANRRRFELVIHFRPSPALILPRGFSLIFTTGADERGYTQIFPNISPYRIVPFDDMFDEMFGADPTRLRNRFASGLLHPRDRTYEGHTYLHVRTQINLTYLTDQYF